MPTFRTAQLIRDKRVEVFEAEGCTLAWRRLEDEEFLLQLRSKLLEEATEAALEEQPEAVLKELADVLEIVESMAGAHGFSMDDVVQRMHARRAELGGFEERVFSESVTAPEGSESAAYHRRFPEKYPEIEGEGTA